MDGEGVGAVPGAKSDMKVTGALANDAKTYIDAWKDKRLDPHNCSWQLRR